MIAASLSSASRGKRPDAEAPMVRVDSAVSTTCLYTQTPDHHFVIDRQGPIVVAAGFSGHGFKFGPALGELIVRLVLDAAATPPLFAFGPR